MIDRRRMLAGGASLLTGTDLLAAPARAQDTRSLPGIAAAHDFIYGSATATWQLKDTDFAALLPREAAMLVPDYEMKRKDTEPVRGHLTFGAVDALFDYAARNGMLVRGHPLVWHAANPPWLADAVASTRDERLMTGFIQAVLTRYRGRMHSVDVVNEAIAPDGNGFRKTLWLDAFGPGYIDTAFHAAQAADPSVLLVYNDWGCEQGTPLNDRFRATTLNFLDGLLKRRVPVQALGLQAHLAAFGPHVDQRKLRDFLGEVQARGLALLVTELDVEDSGGPTDIAVRDRAVADETRRFLDVVMAAPNLKAVLTWDLSDRYLDPPDDWKLRLVGWKGRRLPLDTQMKRKPMWEAMAASFAGRRLRY